MATFGKVTDTSALEFGVFSGSYRLKCFSSRLGLFNVLVHIDLRAFPSNLDYLTFSVPY